MSSDPDHGATAPPTSSTNDAPAAAAPPASLQTPPAARMGAWAVVSRWLQTQQRRNWWRVLAGWVAGLVILWFLIASFQLGLLVPVYVLAFALLAPATVALYWWESGAPGPYQHTTLLVAVGGGAVAGLAAGLLFYDALSVEGNSFLGALVVAVVAEALKVGGVAYLLLDQRLRRERDGLILGAVAALGFSTLITIVAALSVFVQTDSGAASGFSMFRPSLANMDHVLSDQLLLQLCGDWIWTAILCAAIWRERGAATFAPTRGLGIAAAIVMALHFLWQYSFANDWLKITFEVGYIPIFTALVAVAGLVVLSFFAWEALDRASLGPNAPLPPPLEQALPAYLAGLWRRLSRQA